MNRNSFFTAKEIISNPLEIFQKKTPFLTKWSLYLKKQLTYFTNSIF